MMTRCDCVHRSFTLFRMECERSGNEMLVQLVDLALYKSSESSETESLLKRFQYIYVYRL